MILSETAAPINSVHLQFAQYFGDDGLRPYLYLLSKRMAEGHVCLDLPSIALANDEQEELALMPNENGLKSELVGRANELRPFIINDQKLYLQRYFSYETDFIEGIRFLINKGKENKQARIESLNPGKPLGKMLKQLFPQKHNEVDWQLAACMVSYISKLSIITGGPGTGKTTTLRKLLALLLCEAKENRQKMPKILLGAPTGKASARMKQSLSAVDAALETLVGEEIASQIKALEPATIHRMLGYIPNSIYFRHNENYKLDADIIIIDECSMIDIALFAKMMTAIDTDRTRVVLLGDRNQLASVDAGSLFGDLCESLETLNEFDAITATLIEKFQPVFKPVQRPAQNIQNPLFGHVVELQKSYRFSDSQGIGAFSKAVLNGDVDQVAKYFNKEGDILLSENPDFKQEKAGTWINSFAKKLLDTKQGYAAEPSVEKALKKINHSKILCATRLGPNGSATINTEISDFIKKGKGGLFYENRLLMVLKNQRELGIYNGDVGIVRTIPAPTFYLENTAKNDKPKQLAAGNIDQATDAYAITIHKSQGSEFDHVLVVIPDGDEHNLLSRELLYTAVTRAKLSVVITGSREAILASVARKVSRISGIKNRLSA